MLTGRNTNQIQHLMPRVYPFDRKPAPLASILLDVRHSSDALVVTAEVQHNRPFERTDGQDIAPLNRSL